MNLEEIRAFCHSLPGVTEDIKWGDHLCFSAGGKMFLVTAPDEFPISASIKASDGDFELLSARPGFKPAPYMARNKWVYMDDIRLMEEAEWTALLREAWSIVVSRLPKKTQKELGLLP